jgi:hypothetical protein
VDGAWRGIAGVGAWAAGLACGPTYVDGPHDSAGATGSASDVDDSVVPEGDDGSATVSATATETATLTATETATLTATDTATLTATDTATLTVTDTVTDTVDDGTGAGMVSAISYVGCQDDGTVAWLAEIYVLEAIDGCVPPFDVDPQEILHIGISDWDGEAGVFTPGSDGSMAMWHTESLSGTVVVEVSAPYYPASIEYDLVGEVDQLTGSIDLEPCSFVDPPPCDTGTTG